MQGGEGEGNGSGVRKVVHSVAWGCAIAEKFCRTFKSKACFEFGLQIENFKLPINFSLAIIYIFVAPPKTNEWNSCSFHVCKY